MAQSPVRHSNETSISPSRARGAEAVRAREQKDRILLEELMDRIDTIQYSGLVTLEEKGRSIILTEEEAALSSIERSKKAHYDFVVVDAERIRREQVQLERYRPDIGLELLYQSLQPKAEEDPETVQIQNDRRRRVAELLKQKEEADLVHADLEARRKESEKLSQQAKQQQEQIAEKNRRLWEKRQADHNELLAKQLEEFKQKTEQSRQERIQRAKEKVEFVRKNGNTKERLLEAQEKRKRLRAIEQSSNHLRRGLIKKQSQSHSPASSRRSSPQATRASSQYSRSQGASMVQSEKEKAVRQIQSFYASLKSKDAVRTKKLETASIQLQSAFRIAKAREIVAEKRRVLQEPHVMKLQGFFRACFAKSHVTSKAQESSAATLQGFYRARIAKAQVSRRQLSTGAVLAIQGFLRGWQARVMVNSWLEDPQQYHARRAASLAIQSRGRQRIAAEGVKERRETSRRGVAALVIQRKIRSLKCRREIEVKRAALKLQRFFRQCQARADVLQFQRIREAALTLQKFYRQCKAKDAVADKEALAASKTAAAATSSTTPAPQAKPTAKVPPPDYGSLSAKEKRNLRLQETESKLRAESQKRKDKLAESAAARERRRQEEREALARAKELRRAAHERRVEAKRQEDQERNALAKEKGEMRHAIESAGAERRRLEALESQVILAQLNERIEMVKKQSHPLQVEIQSMLQDAKVVAASHDQTKQLQEQLDEEERHAKLNKFLTRFSAEASKQQELEALRDQRTADNSRIWHQKYMAKNERQEVAKLQQLMEVRQKAMLTKMDSLMAWEVTVQNRAQTALQNQRRVLQLRREKLKSETSGERLHRVLLERLYERPPSEDGDSGAPSTTQRSQSAMEYRSSNKEDQHQDRHAQSESQSRQTPPPASEPSHAESPSPSKRDPKPKQRFEPPRGQTRGQQRDRVASNTQHLPAISRSQLSAVKRANTPQPTRVLPLEFLEPKPSLVNPSPQLLKHSKLPEPLKAEATKLYYLLEEQKGPQMHTSEAFARAQTSQSHSSVNRSGAVDESTNSVGTAPPPPVVTPRTVKKASDRLTKMSIAQEAMRLAREHDAAMFHQTTIHDNHPKVTSPSKRLYEPYEDVLKRREAEEAAKKQQLLEAQLRADPNDGRPPAADIDQYFATRFYKEPIDRHRKLMEVIQQNTLKKTEVLESPPRLGDSDVADLVSRLTKVRRKEDAQKISKTTKQLETQPEAVAAGAPSPLVDRLYTKGRKEEAEETARLTKLYLSPLENHLKQRTKKLSREQLDANISDRENEERKEERRDV